MRAVNATKVLVSASRLSQDLGRAFNYIESDAAVLHTDLIRIGVVPRLGSREQQLADYLSSIVESADGRTLLFPTFNYDFFQTAVYDLASDPCQVGTLNEYVRLQFPNQRTWTPVFNFCIYDNRSFSLAPVNNPFSAESTFGELANRRSTIIFFGATFAANTFTHRVEEIMNIGYRYMKAFPGVIKFGGGQRKIPFRFRARPLDTDLVDYDWERLSDDLLDNGIMNKFRLGNGQLLFYRADQLAEYWCSRLRENELFLLTPPSQENVKKLFERHGKPLLYESMEHP